MKFASLGSGSSGNSTLVASDSTIIMVDCGFPLKETERRLANHGVSPEEISSILVTHEHSDHIKGVGPLARRYHIPVYMTEGTYRSRDIGVIEHLKLISDYEGFFVGEFDIRPIAVPHDAREPSQFVIKCRTNVLGILTDLGCVTSHIIESYRECTAILIEANHDLTMLANGPYPPSLRARVASDWGHLNNQQTLACLKEIGIADKHAIVIGHVSQKNNSPDAVKSVFDEAFGFDNKFIYACQEEGFGWISLDQK